VVKAPRKTPGPGALRPLNLPEPLRVEAENGTPVAVDIRGTRQAVVSIEDLWRVEEEWWRDSPIVRTYFEAILENGRRLTLFLEHTDGKWYSQRHG
jgi:hypothetical protein